MYVRSDAVVFSLQYLSSGALQRTASMLQLKRGKGDSISGGLHSDELVVALDGRESVSRASPEGPGGFVKKNGHP